MKDVVDHMTLTGTDAAMSAHGKSRPDRGAQKSGVTVYGGAPAPGLGMVAATEGELWFDITDPREDLWDILRPAQGSGPDSAAPAPGRLSPRQAAAARAFDQLRTQLLQALRAEGLSRVAVVSPNAQGGATFTAVNLALGLARVPGLRTVLLDLNQRSPGVAQALSLKAPGDIAACLSGEVSLLDHLVRQSEGLALGLTDRAHAQASDLLQGGAIAGALDEMEGLLDPDIVLVDLPPMLDYDDASAFLPHVDGVLLVADGTRTQARHIAECERRLAGRSKLMGVVLNRARA